MSETKNYEQQEHMILRESNKFVQYLVDRGLLKDPEIADETAQKNNQKRKYNLYHNTLLLLKNYRNICWQLKHHRRTGPAPRGSGQHSFAG